ncbi:hypothetical protein FISHEDRAFT_71085 [Fistulina hepatica ATCC 64428]|nr:hypothetical protein FISHEDRAFT_71085 [Fistulina hepatica ATCC 64428]
MSNAPPTPPPTSEIEIQDARTTEVATTSSQPHGNADTASSATAGLSSGASEPDPYEPYLESMAELVSRGEFGSVVDKYEYIDAIHIQPPSLTVMAPVSLCLLVLDQTPAAHAALARLPSFEPMALALLRLVASVSERKYHNIYSRVEALRDILAKSAFPAAPSYETVPLGLARLYLGMPDNMLISAATRLGWLYDDSTTLFKLVAPSSTSSANTPEFFEASSLRTFDLVATSVARLEL